MTQNNSNLQQLFATISALRGTNGCPWDKIQTPSSLIKYLESETSELVTAINNADSTNTCEELGDVLYLLLMITSWHNDQSDFNFNDVITQVNDKLIRRHPHVFEGKTYKNQEELDQQWREIKSREKQNK